VEGLLAVLSPSEWASRRGHRRLLVASVKPSCIRMKLAA
jgi:hypothetical protein